MRIAPRGAFAASDLLDFCVQRRYSRPVVGACLDLGAAAALRCVHSPRHEEMSRKPEEDKLEFREGRMADKAKLAVFQDLRLRGTINGRTALREALVNCASEPWRHSADREQDMAAHAGADADVIVFERDESGGVDAVALVLWSRDDGFEVTNIVPREIGELGQHRYNTALRDFVERVAHPAAAAAGFTVEVSSAAQGLDDWLPRDAADALRRFSVAANKATGSSHPMDRRRWFAFLFAAHHDRGAFDTDRLMRWLTEVEGWSEQTAHDLAVEYEFGLKLLDEYDRDRS